jgi:hypothetical protein
MAVAYPFGLRTVIRAEKARSQPAGFSMAQPRRGMGYAQALGTEPPAFWEVNFRFTAAEALNFILWFTQTTQRGLIEFQISLRTEFGVFDHICWFLPDAVLDAREVGDGFEYRATIMARALVTA